jgi:hypothetical protein
MASREIAGGSFSAAGFLLHRANEDQSRKHQALIDYISENTYELCLFIENYEGGATNSESTKPLTVAAIQEVLEARATINNLIPAQDIVPLDSMPSNDSIPMNRFTSNNGNNGNATLVQPTVTTTGNGLVNESARPANQTVLIDLPRVTLSSSKAGIRKSAPVLETRAKFSFESLDNYSFMSVIEKDIRQLIPIIIEHLSSGKNATEEHKSIANTLDQYFNAEDQKNKNLFLRALIDSFEAIDKYSDNDKGQLKRKIAITWFARDPYTLTGMKNREFVVELNSHYSTKFNNGDPIFAFEETEKKIMAYISNNGLKKDFCYLLKEAVTRYKAAKEETQKKA